MNDRNNEYYQKNKLEISEKSRKWYEKNKESCHLSVCIYILYNIEYV